MRVILAQLRKFPLQLPWHWWPVVTGPAERLAGEVVHDESLPARLDERESAQPLERGVGIGALQQVGQQRLGDDPYGSRCFERRTLCLVTDLLHEPRQQRADDIRGLVEVKRLETEDEQRGESA